MKLIRTLLLLLPVALCGCIPFLHALHTPETTVFRQELIGMWKDKPDSEESWSFTKGEGQSYKVTIQQKEGTSTMIGHLVKLEEQLYLDLYPTDDDIEKSKIGDYVKMTLVPAHLILKVKIGADLQMQMLEPEAFKKLLTADPEALRHVYPEKELLVITATTAEIQKFMIKNAKDTKLWGDPGTLKKVIL